MAGREAAPEVQPMSRLTLAHVACLCLGIACICWGLAPAVVERVVSGHAPRLATVLSGSLTVVVGILFLALHVFVRRGRRWAMWSALSAAVVIFGFSLPTILAGQTTMGGSFLPIFAACAALTNWLGLKVDELEKSEAAADWRGQPGVSHLQPANHRSATSATANLGARRQRMFTSSPGGIARAAAAPDAVPCAATTPKGETLATTGATRADES